MKEKKTVPEKTIVIDIKLTRRVVTVLACGLVVVGLLAYLMLTGESAAAVGETSPAQSSGMREFYLTQYRFHDGNDALTACAEGYHFASLWELVDPSNLRYNTSLGYTRADSGQGPPAAGGWVRTGYQSSTNQTFPGRGNCAVWTSDATLDYGTTILLPFDWTLGVQDMGVWDVTVNSCHSQIPVWCIED